MSLPLKEESWIWYSLVIFVAAARFASRILLFRGDLRKLQIDDYIIALALCSYTTLIVTINIVAFTESNLLPPGFDKNSLTPSDVAERKFGSKLVLVVEQCQCVTIWAVKACLLIMYYRLTIALKENIAVKLLSVYVTFGFVFMEIFYFGVWCRPFSNYWAVPTPNTQCNAATNHLITNAVFNISSDLFLLVLALQMIVRSRLPLHRKLVVGLIFGIGVFVILASILNKYYSFTNPFGGLWTYWYTRESSTSLLVANLPYTWTLLRRLFNLRSFDGRSSGTGTATDTGTRFNYHSGRTARGRHASVQPALNGEPVLSAPAPAKQPNGKLLRRSDSHTIASVDLAAASSVLDNSSSRSSATAARSSDNPLLKPYHLPHAGNGNGNSNSTTLDAHGRADQEALMCLEPWDLPTGLRDSVAEEEEEEDEEGGEGEGAYPYSRNDDGPDREKRFRAAYDGIDPARLGLDSRHREAADLRDFERAMLRGDAWDGAGEDDVVVDGELDEEAAVGGDAGAVRMQPVPVPVQSPSPTRGVGKE